MVVSVAGILFTIIFTNVDHYPWYIATHAAFSGVSLPLLPVALARHRDEAVHLLSLLVSQLVALALIMITFVFNQKKDTVAGVASYVSDGLLMGEVLLLFLLQCGFDICLCICAAPSFWTFLCLRILESYTIIYIVAWIDTPTSKVTTFS